VPLLLLPLLIYVLAWRKAQKKDGENSKQSFLLMKNARLAGPTHILLCLCVVVVVCGFSQRKKRGHHQANDSFALRFRMKFFPGMGH